MPHIQGAARDEVLLLPPALDDYISQDNPVRAIDAFVDSLDLVALGFTHALASPLGRPAYHPGDLLKLYLYGYLNRLRSSRLLERESRRNLELIWLLKKLSPDHKTIANFRKDNLQAIQQMCRALTLLCKELDLFGAELVAIDGSKFKAVNNRKRNFNDEKLSKALAHIEQQLTSYLQELDVADRQEASEAAPSFAELQERIAELQARKQQYEQLQQTLAASGESQISLTDPDSRAMPLTQGVDVCYNVQLVVDAKHKLIVAEAVTNDGTDHHQLAPMAKQAKQLLGVEQLSAVADRGYYYGEQVQECDAADIVAYVSKPQTSRNQRKGLFTKEDFRYDALRDSYWCPQGEELSFRSQSEHKGRPTRYYATTACGGCPLRAKCSENKRGRRITRWAGEACLEAMQERVRANPSLLKLRKALIEHVFGTIKRSMDQGYFLLRTRKKVEAEISLTVTAYNFKRLWTILGVKGLIEAIHKQISALWRTGYWWFRLPVWRNQLYLVAA